MQNAPDNEPRESAARAGSSAPLTIVCPNCRNEVQNGAIYCPHCCGGDAQQVMLRAAIIGALAGAVAGALLAWLGYSIVGLERGTWGMAFGVIVTCATTGLMLAMVRQRKR